jgi:hypothetical protein
MGILSKTWTKCPVCSGKNNSDNCGGDIQSLGHRNKRKRKGARNSVASDETADTTLSFFLQPKGC